MPDSTTPPRDEPRPIAPAAVDASQWFVKRAQDSLLDNLVCAAVYGPAVTEIFDPRQHRIHVLLLIADRNVDQLLDLAKHSSKASRQRISPPLVMTADAAKKSRDVFPLEWLDIFQFHRVMSGELNESQMSLDSKFVRLQCERELRSLDIHLQQGILASGGKASRVGRLEDESSDVLVRILRGISWLSGDRVGLLPSRLISRCQQITELELPGCAEAIKAGGRHDINVVKSMLNEIGTLSDWIDAKSLGTR